MNKEILKSLINTPSPSGYEQCIQNLIYDTVEQYADEVDIDGHGNVIAKIDACKSSIASTSHKNIMLAAHCDQIGLIVTHIDARGYISVESVGGWDPQQLVGQSVSIYNKKKSIDGIIGKKPIHLMKPEERTKASKITDLWIDIGAKDRKQAMKNVSIGDYVTTKLNYQEMMNDKLVGTAMDDKAGVFACIEAFKQVAENKDKLSNTVFFVSTVQEEVGTRGAITSTYDIDPDIGIAVDVTFATDCPSHNPKEQGDVKMGAGPVIQLGPNITPFIGKKMMKTAKKNKIPFQVTASGRMTGTDARSIQISRSGVSTGLISIPNRYMHSGVEMVSLKDLTNISSLLAKFCMRKFK